MDMLPPFAHQGITPSTYFQCYLLMVDRTSRKPHLVGLHDYTSESGITAINEFTAPCNHPVAVEHINIRKIKTYDGTHLFNSSNLCEACATVGIQLSIAAPTHQEKNHTAERTWYSLQTIDDAMHVHARLPPKFTHHLIRYAINFFSVLPVNKFINKPGETATPYELFYEKKPLVNHFRVCGCPCVTKKYTITTHEEMLQQTQQVRRVSDVYLLDPP
jgi:hypothetical protein